MNKKCIEIESLLSAFLENELPQEEMQDIALHLDSCSRCLELKEKLEEILQQISDLQEEVPFFLKNRLFNIPETVEKRELKKLVLSPKWLAAALGTIILFFNLFYFTNIFPPANREVHSFVYSIEKLVARAGGWFEKVKESKDLLLFTFFNKKPTEVKNEKVQPGFNLDKELNKGGGKNG